ncbi:MULTISPECIES: antitoxin Xre-like helix-turn-helix domain-containing protein [Thalassospira]|uniref:antitoxin Xre-like helix-turn-helix domain-containing protein n=1 Tax=Thalassospira TaxID=168934 RepID=UPI000A57B7D8|nr:MULTISPECIES: antitoxin Xre-like helix-turn-helix domain-containing protein [Thalassospira]
MPPNVPLNLEEPGQRLTEVALKALTRIFVEWRLSQTEAAAIADLSASSWKRIEAGDYNRKLSKDQMLRIGNIVGIYKCLKLYFNEPIASKWISLENDGPLFRGQRPVDSLIEQGLPQFFRVRTYLGALLAGQDPDLTIEPEQLENCFHT